MDYTQEVQTKLARARELMAAHQVDTLWLRSVNSVAWITGGLDTAINTADTVGVGTVVITADSAQVWTNTIEGPRFRSEDKIEARGFELHVSPWYDAAPPIPGTRIASDVAMPGLIDLGGEISRLRARLLPVERDRFRALGATCADAMHRAIYRVKPGHSEFEIAAALGYETRSRGVTPIVVLVATDERIRNYRHPMATAKILDRYAMLVLCGRKDGLVCSVTRLVHFGKLSDDLRRRMIACTEVDAAVIAASQPGATMADIFKVLENAYAQAGFPGEWKLHHQGGTAGYAARETLVTPNDLTPLEVGMTCAWNPTITGAKVEDTIMVSEAGKPAEILTAMEKWPTHAVTVNGMTFERPVALEIE